MPTRRQNLTLPLDARNAHPEATRTERALQSCLQAKQFEKVGEYDAAFAVLSEFWPNRNDAPNIEGLETATRAELLLRAGSLAGWLGVSDQTHGGQEVAKDLITQSVALFEQAGLAQKAADARTDLAVCYWREGSYDEARLSLSLAIAQFKDVTDEKGRALIIAAMIEHSANRLHDALRFSNEAEPFIERSRDHQLKGTFHNQLAIIFTRLARTESRGSRTEYLEDYMDRALIEYAAASFHFEQAANKRYMARVENNLGFALFTTGRYEQANQHLERARKCFSEMRDHGSRAQVDDSRARVLLAQGRNKEAEKVVRSAVKTLEKGDQRAVLAEVLTTHGLSLARLGKTTQARSVLERAVEIAETVGDPETAGNAALTTLEELTSELTSADRSSLFDRAAALLKLSNEPATITRLVSCARKLVVTEKVETKRKLRVFLCHAREDKPVVKNLYQQLLDHNVDPWLDDVNLLAGQDWRTEIGKAVRSSDAVLVCLSKTSTSKTGFVQKEIKDALEVADEHPDGTIFIIPVKLEKCVAPERLALKQWVNLHDVGGFSRLLYSLKRRAVELGVQPLSDLPAEIKRDAYQP